MWGMVKYVFLKKLIFNDGNEVFYGFFVWLIGVGLFVFIKSFENFEKLKGGRIGVDDYLWVFVYDDVYVFGDCVGYVEWIGKFLLFVLV